MVPCGFPKGSLDNSLEFSYFLITGYDGVDKIKEFYGGRMADGLYHCKVCGFFERNNSNMRAHVESKHYSPGYPCPICGKIFKIHASKNLHYKTCLRKIS